MTDRTVFKYLLEGMGENKVYIQGGGKVLHVAVQAGEVYVWALVDPEAREHPHRFFVHGTGHIVHEDANHHIGTIHLPQGFVFHVFTAV